MTERVDVIVATVGRAHGLRGEVAVHVRTDEPERRLAAGARVTISGRAREVARVRNHSGTLLVTFAGVGDRTAAEALRGQDVWAEVPADEAPTATDEYYDRHLVGLAVRDAAGVEVGSVAEVLHLPAHDVLSVRTVGGDRLVPFVAALVPVVDLEGGFVQIAEVGGLLSDEDDA